VRSAKKFFDSSEIASLIHGQNLLGCLTIGPSVKTMGFCHQSESIDFVWW
jgi:hypothetical protein